jgi:hypothetical protein
MYIVDDDSFLQENLFKPAERNGRNRYNYTSFKLKKGSIFFRGGQKPTADVPAFFGPLTTAKIYSRGNDKKIYAYTVRKEPKLLQLSYKNLITLFDEDERLSPVERAALDMYLVVGENTAPYVIPIEFFTPENRPTEGRHAMYLNRRILRPMNISNWQ